MPVRTPRPKSRRNRRPGEDGAQRARAVQALDLRIAGASYRQIAAQLGVSEYTTYRDVQDELLWIVAMIDADVPDLELERLCHEGDFRAATQRIHQQIADLRQQLDEAGGDDDDADDPHLLR